MERARAVVIGAGIGGLAAAAGLCAAGWDVTACERATSLEPVGAGLALGPNGLRALDVIVAADGIRSAVRQALFPGHPGLRYAGFTTWRLLVGPVTGPVPMSESWGRGA